MAQAQRLHDPLVSVVVPTYNRGRLLPRCIESILAQTYQNLEVLVVDDGSTDDTRDVVGGLAADARVRYLPLPTNQGANAARNAGIRQSTGALVAFLDSDDEWLSEKLAVQVDAFRTLPEPFGAVYCAYFVKHDHRRRALLPQVVEVDGNALPVLLNGWCPATPSMFMLRRDVFSAAGIYFDEEMRTLQDLDFWIRLADRYQFKFVPQRLVIKHNHLADQASMNLPKRIAALATFERKMTAFIDSRSSAGTARRLANSVLRQTSYEIALASAATGRGEQLRQALGVALRNGFLGPRVLAKVGAALLKSALRRP